MVYSEGKSHKLGEERKGGGGEIFTSFFFFPLPACVFICESEVWRSRHEFSSISPFAGNEATFLNIKSPISCTYLRESKVTSLFGPKLIRNESFVCVCGRDINLAQIVASHSHCFPILFLYFSSHSKMTDCERE